VIWRILVTVAGIVVVAAATHANVLRAGGYTSDEAPLIVTIAALLTLGMGYVGTSFRDGRWIAALALGVCLLAGETYWVLLNAEREIARREANEAPTLHARGDRATAEARVTSAEAALLAASAAVVSEAAKPGCLKNCAAMLTASEAAAKADVTAARTALANVPRVLSSSPLPERLGVAPWLWDLIMAGLRSLAVVGGSIAIGMTMHGRNRFAKHAPPPEPQVSASPARLEILPPQDKREHASRFLRTVLRPEPTGQASLKKMYERYPQWCTDAPPLPAAELGRELRGIFDALGLRCEAKGRDVIVHGTVISD
jgi:hypothetical protein